MTMWQQYLSIKKDYPDVILFFRLGDFYETFGDDAKLVAEVLDITLTVRGLSKDDSTPMAGIPYHAVDSYLEQLVGQGYRVAICEQMDDMVHKTLQKREVVRVVTPGTLTEPTMLRAESNSYLVAVFSDRGRIGLAYADLTTGEFCATELASADAAKVLEGELVRLNAAEILASDAPEQRPAIVEPRTKQLESDLAPMRKAERERLLPHERSARKVAGTSDAEWTQGNVTLWASWRWDLNTAREALIQQFAARSLDGYGLQGKPMATRAAGALIQYLRETQRDSVAQIRSLRVYDTNSFMFLDPQTRRNLELLEGAAGARKHSLIAVLDQTRTPMGARLLRQWISQPLIELEPLLQRQDLVARFVEETLLRNEIRAVLKGIGDLERTVNRMIQGIATPRDLVRLRESLQTMPDLQRLLAEQAQPLILEHSATPQPSADDADLFDDWQPDSAAPLLDPCADICDLLQRAIADDPPALLGTWDNARTDENIIRKGFAPEIDQVVAATRDASTWINELEGREQERTGIKSLKVSYNKVFGYYIEVSKATADAKIPDDYIRRQTLVNAERYITPELKEYESIILNASELLNERERTIFKQICRDVGAAGPRLLQLARTLATLDVATTLAEVAVRNRYVRPILRSDDAFMIVEGRHPVVEQSLADTFIPNDARFDSDSQIMVLTGPNMAGKCVVGSSQVFTARGLRRMQELMPAAAAVEQFTPLQLTVQGQHGPRQASHFYRGQPHSRTRQLTTAHGFTLEGTPQHRVWVQAPDGQTGWKTLGELSLGDQVALSPGGKLWGRTTQLAPFAPSSAWPQELTPALAYSLGLLSGCGHISATDQLTLTLPAAVHATAWSAALSSAFGSHVEHSGDTLKLHKPALGAFLEHCGWSAPTAPAADVPKVILSAPEPYVLEYLRGLFESSATSADAQRTLTLAAAPLAQTVQLLLLNCGIVAKRTQQAAEQQLTLSTDAAQRLHRLLYQREQAVAASPRPDCDLYVYDPITDLRDGQADVFDLSVEVDHAYVVNGLVSHNSTYLRQTALIALMAQIGAFVPADHAEIGLIDRIFTRIGAQDDIATGQSTFMVEMIETANILHNATPRSLIILDEIGRGTSTYDGLSIARAVIEYIHNQPRLRAKTLFATHYHELTDLANILPRVENWTMAVAEEGDHVVFLRKVVRGAADRSYGIHVAQMAGLPASIVKRANQVLAELEGRGDKEQRREAMRRVAPSGDMQMSLFAPNAAPSPAVEALRTLDVTQLTPIEALTKLYELQHLVREDSSDS